jgi:hydroxymethylbilane synthase
MEIILGTRGSQLAVWQANHIKSIIGEIDDSITVEINIIKTTGDLNQSKSLPSFGTKGLFTKEIEDSLLDGKIDVAVHSLKDLPSVLPEGLVFAGSPKRNDYRDCFISSRWKSISDVPNSGKIATGSTRRQALIHELNPNIQCTELRGNINTRLKKLEDHELDGIIMATAALNRLNMQNRITEYLDPKIFVPSIGQGAIGLEIKEGSDTLAKLVAEVSDDKTLICVNTERAFMKELEGGCSIPIGAFASINEDQLTLTGYFSSLDGKNTLRKSKSGPITSPEELGITLADDFKSHGVLKWLIK